MAGFESVVSGGQNPVLNTYIQGFYNDPSAIAPKISPLYDVGGINLSCTIFQFLGHEYNKLYTGALSAPGSNPPRIPWTLTSATRALNTYRLESEVPDDILKQMADPVKMWFYGGDMVKRALQSLWEFQVFNVISTVGNYAGANAAVPAPKWGQLNDVPITDINTGITRIKAVTGKRPNFMIIDGIEVFPMMQTMPEFAGVLANDKLQILTETNASEVLAAYFKIETVYITTDEDYFDDATGLYLPRFTQDCIVLGYSDPTGDINTPKPSLVNTYYNPRLWDNRVYYEDRPNNWVFQSKQTWLVNMTANTYGYILSAVVT